MSDRILPVEAVIADRYEVLRYIAAGGMQEVYCAFDRYLDRHVALKVPKNNAAERRFKRSAILSARVNHPNAAKTLDYVECGDKFYLVEELIDGRDLSTAKQDFAAMDPYLTAHILHHLAKGVAAAHHAQVVHRDLKPSNVMVSKDLSFTIVKITDFGISKMAEEELDYAVGHDFEASISSNSTVKGALPYLAPEMIRKPKEAHAEADVWAVGAMAFELLTGQKPFGKGLLAVDNILRKDLPPLPRFVTANIQFAPLAQEIYEIIRACVSKDPACRPTADQLVQSCESLCYPECHRRVGVVRSKVSTFAFIDADDGTVFFHSQCVYGVQPLVGQRVCFTSYPGSPYARGIPVITLNDGKE